MKTVDGYEHHIATFSTLRDKADYLDTRATLDSLTHDVRAKAREITRGIVGDEEQSARALQRWVRDKIAYVHDRPTLQGAQGEEFASSQEILRRLYDDCDGKSRVLVALCRSLGIRARIRPVFPAPNKFTHVQVEIYIPGRGWLLAETIVQGAELGDDPRRIIRENGGHVPLAGPRHGFAR